MEPTVQFFGFTDTTTAASDTHSCSHNTMKKQLSAVEYRPSGRVLPLVLQRAHHHQVNNNNNTSKEHDKDGSLLYRPQQQQQHQQLTRLHPRDRKWDAESIEQALQQSWRALGMIQEQILRGEETYYDETQTLAAGANIFRGWDAYPDSRLTLDNSNHIYDNTGLASRRMPADFRWFSGSCADPVRFSRARPPVKSVDLASVQQMELPPFDPKAAEALKEKDDDNDATRKESSEAKIDSMEEETKTEEDEREVSGEEEADEVQKEPKKSATTSKRRAAESSIASRRPKRRRR